MLVVFIFLGLLSMPSMLTMAQDPAPGMLTTIEESRRLLCERASIEAARKAHPGLIEAARPRGDFFERAAVECTEPLLGVGERDPRDAAILRELSSTTAEVAAQLAARDGVDAPTWLVEVHYPNPSVVSKVAFATKGALVSRGLEVTDRLPTLAAGDIEVLAQTPPLEAYPLACRRYFAEGRLGPEDAVLSLLVLDRRETSLHAGACENGRWTWLR